MGEHGDPPTVRTYWPALLTGLVGFLATAGAAAFGVASQVTWIAGFIGLWCLTGTAMAALWPAPVPTRAQAAATRGEESTLWPAMRARLVPLFSPWMVGLGAYVGIAARRHGWGGTLRASPDVSPDVISTGLAPIIALSPLGVMLTMPGVALPVLYAWRHSGSRRLWGLARATGFAGMLGLMTCALLSSDAGGSSERGSADPVEAARFIGHLLVGHSESRPGWLIAVAYVAITLLATGLTLLIRSEHAERAEGERADHTEDVNAMNEK